MVANSAPAMARNRPPSGRAADCTTRATSIIRTAPAAAQHAAPAPSHRRLAPSKPHQRASSAAAVPPSRRVRLPRPSVPRTVATAVLAHGRNDPRTIAPTAIVIAETVSRDGSSFERTESGEYQLPSEAFHQPEGWVTTASRFSLTRRTLCLYGAKRKNHSKNDTDGLGSAYAERPGGLN